MHPEETTEDESEKEQRVENPSQEEDEIGDFGQKEQRIAEVQAEWVLLLHALDMDTSSQFPDVLSEVRVGVCSLMINYNRAVLTGMTWYYNAGGDKARTLAMRRDERIPSEKQPDHRPVGMSPGQF